MHAHATLLCVRAEKLVCRYLFRRCDNEPAPWSAADAGDGPWREDDLPDDAVAEITRCAESVTYAGSSPCWDYDEAVKAWGWAKPPPAAPMAGERAARSASSPLDAARKIVRMVRVKQQLLSCHGLQDLMSYKHETTA
jgi:hypothetical protein